jgi:2-oxoglutarate ferredoxin oxidoreductase subunit alpha
MYSPCDDGVPEMADAGEGYRFHVTGVTHAENGYPVITPKAQDHLVRRLVDKIRNNVDDICVNECIDTDNADVIVVAYGITSRVAMKAIQMVRERGAKIGNRKLRIGMYRLITPWPFPDQAVREMAGRIRGFVVPELNLGQMVREVERAAAGLARAIPVSHAGGTVHSPEQIVEAILEAAK